LSLIGSKLFARTTLVSYEWEKGLFTYEQRIRVNKIAQSKITEVEKLKEFIRLFGGNIKRINIFNARLVTDWFDDFQRGIIYWAEREAKVLNYEPTADEKKFSHIAKTFGEFATVDSLADKYKIDPDIILQWEYHKVFMILWKDLELHKLQRNAK
jgi:hypothetical protein